MKTFIRQKRVHPLSSAWEVIWYVEDFRGGYYITTIEPRKYQSNPLQKS